MNNPLKKYYIANWKMYQSWSLVKKFMRNMQKDSDLYSFFDHACIAIAPSYEHIYYVSKKLQKLGVMIGAQDCASSLQAACTGQVSIASLQDMNLNFCIIGHSEVRNYLMQNDMMIATKFKNLLAASISPIVCIGETLYQKNNGMTLQVLYDQLELILEILQTGSQDIKIFIAYEPVYAIGSGIVPSEDDLRTVFVFLHDLINQLPIAKNVIFLYGGSVSPATIEKLQNIQEISGFLIGKASIDFQELKKIVQSKQSL